MTCRDCSPQAAENRRLRDVIDELRAQLRLRDAMRSGKFDNDPSPTLEHMRSGVDLRDAA